MKDLIVKFQKEQPQLVKAMNEASHHYDLENLNPYHLEGDIWTHTNMVCLKAQEMKAPYLVKVAALLHDIGKPMCLELNHEKKRASFYGHEGASVYLGINFLKSLKLSTDEISHVVKLMAMHTDFYPYLKDELYKKKKVRQDLRDHFRGNEKVLLDLLVLAAADHEGRWSDDNSESIMEAFSSLIEIGPRPIKEVQKTATIEVLIGPPLSGKSTYARKKENVTIISRDDIIMELSQGKSYNEAYHSLDGETLDKIFLERLHGAIKEGKNIIVDKTHMSAKTRRSTLGAVPKHYHKKATVFLTDLTTLIERNEVRKAEGKDIPFKALCQMIRSFTVPMHDSFDEIDYIIN